MRIDITSQFTDYTDPKSKDVVQALIDTGAEVYNNGYVQGTKTGLDVLIPGCHRAQGATAIFVHIKCKSQHEVDACMDVLEKADTLVAFYAIDDL